ncbi:MAG: NYN domain-containing protein [Candidatus Omnitrophota bacterium]|nr:NYN domain-containing protein [Candidatus Omnitrophota bacterium]
MPILIDGWNLIRNRRSDIRDDDDGSLDSVITLIAYLEDFQVTHNDPIIVVFDSSREFLDIDHRNSPKLKIMPAKNADNYIKKYLDKVPEKQRRNVRVVSSDNEIYFYARSSYATPVKCEDFWVKLKAGYERL